MLWVTELSKSFGGLNALKDVSFEVAPSEIKAVIGPNGAGKTTLFNIIAGTLRPTSGSVAMDGTEISGKTAAAIGMAGIARTFQQPQVFTSLTVMENVMLGANRFHKCGTLSSGLGLGAARRAEKDLHEIAEKWLAFVGLDDVFQRQACELPLGQQKYVEIARAMATGSRVLLMDEPAAGLDDTETGELGELITRIRGTGMTVLLIDHHIDFVMSLADSVLVLNFGQWLAEGTPDEIRNSQAVIDAYLGSTEDA
ncbi:ABC transporter ATP-binding protein [uncultured Roseibium sp.]|uniref:ABC transporter ATP-binding protein n=1 Tax=uncultured Roseibium sp. TaxID=1936171 RepID=UPI003217AD1A